MNSDEEDQKGSEKRWMTGQECYSRLDCTRRLSRSPRRQEHSSREELRISWTELRQSRMHLLGQAEEWQDLTNAEQRKLDKDEKAVRAEIVKR